MDIRKSDPYLPGPLACFKDKKVWVGMEVSADGKQKRPVNPFTGELASCADYTTWGNFEEAKRVLYHDASARYNPQYLAIALSKELGLIVIDLDDVIDLTTKEIEPWAREIVEEVNSYSEFSQSGKGIHIYVSGNKTIMACRGKKIEVYDDHRFMTITNRPIGEVRLLREAPEELELVYERYLKQKRPQESSADAREESPLIEDTKIIEIASKANNGAKFMKLFFEGEIGEYGGDESRADLALMGILVFWTQCEEQLERLFSNSALGKRCKWQERPDYRKRTIQTALMECSKIYQPAEQKKQDISNDEVIAAYHDNEEGDARIFLKLYQDKYRFDPSEKAFYLWNGVSWELDRKKTRLEDLRGVAKYYENIGLDDEKLLKELKKRAYLLKGHKRLRDVLEITTHGERGITFTGEWDCIPKLLPCANGVIDLQTGKLCVGSSELSIRNVCPINWDPGAKCPQFEKFVSDIMVEDVEMISFIQRLSGYMLMGAPIEHRFVVFWGENGRNGKGTLCRIYQGILGPLARTFSPEMILLQRNPPSSGNPRADLINLQGTRLAIFSEINKKRSLDPSQIKNLSGGDVISARPLFSNEIRNFTPSHTLVIQTNYKPEAPSDDNALWRRALLIPFEAEFLLEPTQPHHKPIDLSIEEKLMKEASGILNWLVQGALEYLEKGLEIPSKVQAAVQEYREENNGIEIFIRERCERLSEVSIKCSTFRDSVRAFCTEEGHPVPSFPDITQYLERQGYEKFHMGNGDYWRGIRIKKLLLKDLLSVSFQP